MQLECVRALFEAKAANSIQVLVSVIFFFSNRTETVPNWTVPPIVLASTKFGPLQLPVVFVACRFRFFFGLKPLPNGFKRTVHLLQTSAYRQIMEWNQFLTNFRFHICHLRSSNLNNTTKICEFDGDIIRDKGRAVDP